MNNTTHNAEQRTAKVPQFTGEELRGLALELTTGVRATIENSRMLRNTFPCWTLLEKVKEVQHYVNEMADALEVAEEWENR